MRSLHLPRALACAVALAGLAGAAEAGIVTFKFEIEFSGGTAPAGSAPWITATFDDSFGGPNTVRLTMTASGLSGTEFIGGLYVNFDPLLSVSSLTISPVNVSAVGATVVNKVANAFKADGDGFFDIFFDFPPPPGNFASKFTMGESVVYDLTYISAITASSFDFLSSPIGANGASSGSPGSFKAAAHVQGIGSSGNDSGWVAPRREVMTVPEPASLAVLGLGLVGLAAAPRRRGRG